MPTTHPPLCGGCVMSPYNNCSQVLPKQNLTFTIRMEADCKVTIPPSPGGKKASPFFATGILSRYAPKPPPWKIGALTELNPPLCLCASLLELSFKELSRRTRRHGDKSSLPPQRPRPPPSLRVIRVHSRVFADFSLFQFSKFNHELRE